MRTHEVFEFFSITDKEVSALKMFLATKFSFHMTLTFKSRLTIPHGWRIIR